MDAEIIQQPELRVATVKHHGSYHEIGEAFTRLGEIAGPAGLFSPGAKMIGVFHDDPATTPEDELHSEAGVTVPPNAKLPVGLSEVRIPAGRVARMTHVGPYERLGDAWDEFTKWLPETGQQVAADGLTYEIYLNTPADTPRDKLRTEMYIPLEPLRNADRKRPDPAGKHRPPSKESRLGDSRD